VFRAEEKKMLSKNYPIKPKHLDMSKEPKGFDNLLNYGQRMMLWGMFQFCQAKGDWKSFTHEEFQSFLDDKQSVVNKYMTSAIMKFVEERLSSLLNFRKENRNGKDVMVYTPAHFLISTYFQWNPAQNLFE
jgi:hypothetical protein